MKIDLSASAAPSLIALITGASLAAPNASAQSHIEAWGNASHGADLASVIQIDGGYQHYLALTRQSTIDGWGSDSHGQISTAPTGSGFVQVIASGNVGLALDGAGTITSWGDDYFGVVSGAPTGTGFVKLAAGVKHAMALRADGSIASWGWDAYGQVLNTPTGSGFIEITVGPKHSQALRSDGSIVAWGDDQEYTLTDAPSGSGFLKVACGGGFGLAIRSNGTITSWGANGNATPPHGSFTDISAGRDHAVAIRADGSLASWSPRHQGPGDTYGQVSETPSGKGFVQVSASFFRTAGIRKDHKGSAYCFGDGTDDICPCQNYGGLGEGCANSTGRGVRLTGVGNARHNFDSFQLEVTGAPHNIPGLVFLGLNPLGGVVPGVPVGDGLLCAGGQVQRSHIQLTTGGATLFSDFAGSSFGSSSAAVGTKTYYQFWYRDVANTCSGSGFNYSNGWRVIWED